MINKENVLIFYKDSLQCEKDSLCYGKGPSTIANVYTLQKQATATVTCACGEKCRSNASLSTLQGTYICKVIFFGKRGSRSGGEGSGWGLCCYCYCYHYCYLDNYKLLITLGQ